MRSRSSQSILLGLAFFLIAPRILTLGQPVANGGWTPFRVRAWTSEQGLPQNHIAAIKQTRDGYLWIGTWFGLARFDGVRFTVFNKLNTPELASDAISALAEDESGTLWIGTKNGLVGYHDHTFRRLTKEDGLPAPDVWRLIKCRAGGIWLHAGRFIARFQDGKFSRVTPAELRGAGMRSIFEEENGSLDICSESGLWRLLPGASELRMDYTNSHGQPMWQAAGADKSGGLWVGTKGGVRRQVNGILTSPAQNVSDSDGVDFIWCQRSGALWVNALPGGIYRLEQTNWVAVDIEEPQLAGVGVICMEEDQEGSLWLGTDRGLFQLHRNPVRAFTKHGGLPSDNVFSVCEGADGNIWAATDRGLGCIRGSQIVSLNEKEPWFEFGDSCVWPNSAGGVWCAKPSIGIVEYQDEKFSWMTQVKQTSYRALFMDNRGRLLAGADDCITALTPQRPSTLAAEPLPYTVRNVHAIFEGSDRTIWFGTAGAGLARAKGAAVDFFDVRNGLSDNEIWSIYQDSENVLWLGTENGLTRFQNGNGFAFRHAQGLPENVINCVLEDDDRNLWLSGLHGIHRFKRAELNEVAAGRLQQAQCFTVGTPDGMISPESNGGTQPAGWKSRDGRLWFATTGGVVAIDPKAIALNEVPPPVAVEQVKANDESIYGTASAKRKVPPGSGDVLEFKYTANTFAAPEQARFRYRLVGADRDWREETTERTARYINLKPGEYQFEVTAANHHNVWNPEPATFSFSLGPRFWETSTFYVSCGFGALVIAAAFHGYRLHWQRRVLKLEEQRNLANERARIARDLHDDLGASLTGIALQLEAAKNRGSAGSVQLADLAEEARSIAHGVRELAWTTNPRCDNSASLMSFITEFAERFCHAAGFACRLELPQADGALPVPARIRYELLAVLKESLANIARHSGARNVIVSLSTDDNSVRLGIRDDGRGFDQTQNPAGTGLQNLRERIQGVGGSLTIQSHPDAGTGIFAIIPVDKK
jgi:signal transduction histidine kinase/ligand-binding sensor domain-containing protein